jgi:hypothetical protein
MKFPGFIVCRVVYIRPDDWELKKFRSERNFEKADGLLIEAAGCLGIVTYVTVQA